MIGAALGLAGSIIGGIGSYQEGQAQAKSLKAQAAQELLAVKEVERAGKYNAWRMNLNKRLALGRQRAIYAALGVDVGDTTTTAIDNLAMTAGNLTLDRLMSIRTSRITAYEHLQTAKYLKKQATAAKKSGLAKAFGSIGSIFG